MSSYPPNPPRKLLRSRSNRVLGGVCAGVATYLNMDVNLVRILTVVLSLFTGVPVVAYIVALFLMPEEQAAPYAGPPSGPAPTAPTGPAGASDPVWGPAGAPWDSAPGNTPPAGSSPPAADVSPEPSPQPGPAPQDASATAAPEGSSVPDAEPVAETSSPEPSPGQESSWESTAADPQEGESSPSGETPPSGGARFEGHKPTS